MKNKRNRIIATLLIIATLATSGAALAAPRRRLGPHHRPNPIEYRRPPRPDRPHRPPHIRPSRPMPPQPMPRPYYDNRNDSSYDDGDSGTYTSSPRASDTFKQAFANAAGEVIGQAVGNVAGEIFGGIFGR